MLRPTKDEWYFIALAIPIWVAAVSVTAWDFAVLQHWVLRPVAVAAGLAVTAAGFYLRKRSQRDLGEYSWCGLRILDGHDIVMRGVYSRVRNPMYIGNFLAWIGVAVALSSAYGVLASLLAIPCFLHRIALEERQLAENFGDAYREYVGRTHRFIPFLY